MSRGYDRGKDRAELPPVDGSPSNTILSGQQPPILSGQQQALWTAAPPRPPAPVRALEQAREAHLRYRTQREGLEQRSMARGLLWLAVAALLVSFARAGVGRVFVHGWWNQW